MIATLPPGQPTREAIKMRRFRGWDGCLPAPIVARCVHRDGKAGFTHIGNPHVGITDLHAPTIVTS